LGWFEKYTLSTLRSDAISGLTVALVLIPQSMAYAQLAGLPSYYGLYASFLPPMIAALFGSSRQLATGPVAVVSLMTAASLEPIATAGSEAFISYAILLALIVGLFQFLLGVLRLGLVVNFLSHPVVNGFTNAAALMEVIVLTGHGSREDKETCLQLGAFAYFEKPLNMEVLTQTMQEAYKKVREQNPNVADRQDQTKILGRI